MIKKKECDKTEILLFEFAHSNSLNQQYPWFVWKWNITSGKITEQNIIFFHNWVKKMLKNNLKTVRY